MFDHYKNGISIVKTSVENRDELLNYFKDARSSSTQKGNTKAYILPDNPNDYTYDVINLMLKHNIEIERATEDFTARNVYDYWDATSANRSFSAGDFIIKTDQPAHLFINTMFRRELELKDSVTYDMTSWSIPLAYNLDAGWTTSDVRVNSNRVVEPMSHPKE